MSDFTYQAENSGRLEYYEWDNLWFDNAPNKTAPRVLVIGDSISCGYRRKITRIADGKYFVDGIGTSKAVDNPSFLPLIDYFISQSGNIKLILFNNGLHGWGLSEKEYKDGFLKLLIGLGAKYPSVKLVLITTTPARNKDNLSEFADNYDRILERNRIVSDIAKEYGITVCDLFCAVKDRKDVYTSDGVHFNDEGYELLAKKCAEIISTLI